MKSNKNNKNHRGSASQFFIAGELCRRGYVAVVTMGNTPNTDILCSNTEGTKFIHIQVKTFRPGDRTCSVGMKAEKNYGSNFFWILGGIPEGNKKDDFVYYIIPSKEIAKHVKESHFIWKNRKRKDGQPRKDTSLRMIEIPPRKCVNGWSIDKYKNRWDLINKKLK